MKLLNYLLILVILTLPLGELIRIKIVKDTVLKPLDLFVGIGSIAILIYCKANNKKLLDSYLSKPLVIFSLIALFSLIVNFSNLKNGEILTAFLYLVRFVSYSSIYFLVIYLDNITLKKYRLLLIISGTIFMILGYVQFFLYANLKNLYYLGWDEHNYRLFSTFLDPNFAGSFLVLLFLLFAANIRKSILFKDIENGIKFGLVSILTLIAIFMTYSRSALLMLIISVTTYLFLIGKKKLLLLPSILTVIFLLILSPSYNKENTNIFRTTSSFARFETYGNALQIIYDYPILGVGFNAYRYAQERYGFRAVESRYPDHATAGTDNSFLFVAATTGIIGLTAYLYIWYMVIKRSFLLRKKKSKFFPPVVIASSFGLFINSFFINSLFYPGIMLWMWILIGFMDQE